MAKEEKKAPKLRFNGYTNDWERKKLGDVAEIVGGGTPSTTKDNYWNGSINWYTPAEIGDKIFIDNSQRKITNLGLKNSSAKILPAGTMLFTSRAGIGKTAILKEEGSTNQGFQSIIPNVKLLDSYFIYSMSNILKKYGESHGAGSTFIEISGKELAKAKIFLPSLIEQKYISKIIYSIDDTIQLHERKCEELALIKQALLQKLFPKKDEVIPEVRYKSFSAAWEQRKLGEIGKVFTGNTPSTKNTENWTTDKSIGHVWITPTDINNNIMFDSERYLSDKGWSQARVVPKNSVLITSIASIGKNAINGVEVAFNQQINALVVQKNNPYFILTLMNKEKQRFESLAGQTATPIINKSTFSSFMVKIPSETEQEQIGEFFKQLDSLIALHQRKLEKLKQLKKFLLQNMFI